MKSLQTIALYLAVLTTISSWWYLALSPSSESSDTIRSLPAASFSQTPSLPTVFPYLSTMDRDSMHQALAGDATLMSKLIAEWDVDARILESQGLVLIKRLPRKLYVQGQLIGRKLESSETSQSIFYSGKFLPQTYQAASYLMALASPEQIVGIPKGLRDLDSLYPKELTDKIPLNIESYQAEALYRTHPSLAIVSKIYTNPSTIQTLQNQNIPLIAQRSVQKIDDISASILEIGKTIGKSQKSELLSIFIEAAMLAIDNRLLAMNHLITNEEKTLTTLYLHYHTQYSTPTSLSLTGQLLDRVDTIFPIARHSSLSSIVPHYSVPIDQETIRTINPECLIVATEDPAQMWQQITATPSMEHLSAVRNKRVFFINESVQLTSDQYLVLAYYDIACSVMNAHVM